MSEANGSEDRELSQAECQEELLQLREALLARVHLLTTNSAAYYYLCSVVQAAPTPDLGNRLAEVVAHHSHAYVADWREVIAISDRAKGLLDQMARQSEVESQLAELEADTAE